MLCHWSSKANTSLLGVVSRTSLSSIPHRPFSSCNFLIAGWGKPPVLFRCTAPSVIKSRYHATPFFRRPALEAVRAQVIDYTPPPKNEFNVLSTSTSSPPATRAPPVPLTSAQLSRAAAQTVRLCGHNGHFVDALYIVNSLKFSVSHHSWDSINHTAPAPLEVREMDPIDFGKAVSPRLAAHCFLHSLIRDGKEDIASKYAEIMMESGIPIRTQTLQRILYNLGAPRTFPRIRMMLPRVRMPIDPRPVLHLQRSGVASEATQAALHLLEHARRFGQRRTRRMYDSLIKACLVQGEIIVAALLFALVVKDWQLRQALLERTAEHITAPDDPVIIHTPTAEDATIPRRSLYTAPEPNMESLHFICHRIQVSFDENPPDADPSYLYPALQALANLVGLVDTGQLVAGSAAEIIRLLYSCPKTDQEVWIVHKNQATRVKAYPYFHDFLLRLITSLSPPIASNTTTAPMLDRTSYNSLLFYALRHRMSPSLASRILQHMTVTRQPPLEPDIATYNILLSSGTLLRRSDIAETALRALRSQEVNATHGIMIRTATKAEESVLEEQIHGTTKFDQTMRHLQTEPFNAPLPVRSPSCQVAADKFTLVSYIKYLTAIGKPHVVCRVLLHIIPGMRRTKEDVLEDQQWEQVAKSNRAQRLQAAVELGPYVLTAIIDALVKAGKTALAERVWTLARNAERASWNPRFSQKVKPWVLSVHTYTSMLQCYADEARKEPLEGDRVWRKKIITGRRRRFMGRVMSKRIRRDAALERGMRVYRSLTSYYASRRYDLYRKLMRSRKTRHRIDNANATPLSYAGPPKPDARFFNAALNLFGRRPHGAPRARRATRGLCRRQMRMVQNDYQQRSLISAGWSRQLQCVARDMMAVGHSVPPGYRHLFVGRESRGSQYLGPPPPVSYRRPQAFSKVPRDEFRARNLVTVKERGLPLRRRAKPVRRRRQRTM